MIRKEAITLLSEKIGNNPIISANGFISRNLFDVCDKPTNFYMIGSMGLASSIGLGIALKNSRKRIYIFDGDGNILMNLGSLATIGRIKPKNLVHIVFDNEIHESTGGQPTHSKQIKIDKIAHAANYSIFKTNSKEGISKIFKKIRNTSGPIFILVKIKKNKSKSKRIDLSPSEIKTRFMKSL